jgi:transposase
MDERLRFVARLLEGEKMAVLCREFDISRKTGYKIFQRYKDCSVQGLTDRSRRGRDRSGREAPLTDPKHAATAGISRHGREGVSYPLISSERLERRVGVPRKR